MAIPKIIIQTYKTTKLPFITRLQIARFKRKNRGYAYQFYDDAAIETFIAQAYNDEMLQLYKRINIGAAKADFFRYLILYKNGGVYVDIDSTISQNLDELILPTDDAIIAKEGHIVFYVQWALVFAPGHPFLQKTIQKMVHNLSNNLYPNDVHQMTGPSVYTDAIKECLQQNPNINYREVDTDYGKFFKFKYAFNKFIYTSKNDHWKTKQLTTSVLK